MTSPKHILSEEGILISFSIAKKINTKELKRIKSNAKKIGSTEEDIKKLLSEIVISETKQSIEKKEIPGLIWPEVKNETPPPKSLSNKRTVELTYLASLLAKKISEKNLSKYEYCYVINSIINILGLNEDDFEDFYEKFSSDKKDDSDEWPDEEEGNFGDGEDYDK